MTQPWTREDEIAYRWMTKPPSEWAKPEDATEEEWREAVGGTVSFAQVKLGLAVHRCTRLTTRPLRRWIRQRGLA